MNVVLVSDRGPYRTVPAGGGVTVTARQSSVTSLIAGVGRDGRTPVWVAASTEPSDRSAEGRSALDAAGLGLGVRIEPVVVDPGDYRRYYDDVGVRALWFAHHRLWPEVGRPPLPTGEQVAAFDAVNRALAERAAELTGAGDPCLVQDYQLALAPAHLRRLRPSVPVAFFLHTPMADWASLSRLPAPLARRVVDGMLAADLVGVQSARWSRRLLECCRRLGLPVDARTGTVRAADGRTVRTGVFPVPVDARRLRDRARSAVVADWVRRFDSWPREALIVRVDRLDPSKGMLRGLRALALLLARRPDLPGRVRLLACVVPSRERIPEYARYADQVWREVDRVNRRWPDTVRVHYGEDADRALAALRSYDVLLVNSWEDGMNLVAQEGPAVNDRAGVLVLSASAGAAEILPAAIRIDDPADVPGTADALETALDMRPAERARRAEALRASVDDRSPADWVDDQLRALPRSIPVPTTSR